ncbi:MAG: leucine-rich repeat protein [Lachnospiraceae bacterium]|nr:leucine-rich repeat protein [Lachnospiraceae bacterium]
MLKLKRKLASVLTAAMVLSSITTPAYAEADPPQTGTKGELFVDEIDFLGEFTKNQDTGFYVVGEDEQEDFSATINGFTIFDNVAQSNSENKISIWKGSAGKIYVLTEDHGSPAQFINETTAIAEFNEAIPGEHTYISFDTTEDSEVIVAANLTKNGTKNVYLSEQGQGGEPQAQEIARTDVHALVTFKAKANKTYHLYADPGVALYYVKVMPASDRSSWEFKDNDLFGALDGSVGPTSIKDTDVYAHGLILDTKSNSCNRLDEYPAAKEMLWLFSETAVYVPIQENKILYIDAPDYEFLSVNGARLTEEHTFLENVEESTERPGYVKILSEGEEQTIRRIAWVSDQNLRIPSSAKNLTYDGSEKTGVIAGEGYTLDGTVKATNAGSYEAYAILNEGFVWIDGTTEKKTIKWSIAKVPLTVTAKDASITYGDEPANNGVTYEGFVNNETESVLRGGLNYSCDYDQYDDVGEYDITPMGLIEDNYSFTYKPGKLTVNKADIPANAVTAPTANKLFYNGEAQTLAKEGSVAKDAHNVNGIGSLYYAVTDAEAASAPEFDGLSEASDKVWSKTVPSKTNAGSYKVWYLPVGSKNYNNGKVAESITTSIARGKATVSANDVGKTYGEADPKLVSSVSGTVEGDTLQYTLEREEGENAGTYKISVKPGENPNYDVETVEGTFTIGKAEATATVEAVENIAYDGEAKALVTVSASENDKSKVYYRLGESGKYSETIPTGVEMGSYDVYYYIKGDENHNDLGSAQEPAGKVTATIGKPIPAFDKPNDKTITCKQTLKDITLEEGFSFMNPDQELTVGENIVKVSFTPEDTENYRVVENIELKVIVKHKLDKTDAKEATTEEEGNEEYYTCTECGKFFSDAEGKNEIEKNSWVIAKLPKQDDPKDKKEDPQPGKDDPKATDPKGTDTEVEEGTTLTAENANAEVTVISKPGEDPAVSFAKTTDKKAKKITVPNYVTINHVKYAVTKVDANAFKGSKATQVTLGKNIEKIAPKAFKGSKISTVTIKSKKLTKSGVKHAFKGSKVKTVILKVKVGKKKENEKYKKQYKKIFTKKIVGVKVIFK